MNPFYNNQFAYPNQAPVSPPFGSYFSQPQQQNFPPKDNLIQSMYTTVQLQPYNNQQFLFKTFSTKADYIAIFLTLPHEDKLKMFMLMQQKRIYGQMNDKEGYQKILRDIVHKLQNYNAFHNGGKAKMDDSEQKKKKDFQSKIDLFCQTSFQKLKLKQDNNPHAQQIKNGNAYLGLENLQQQDEWVQSKQEANTGQLDQANSNQSNFNSHFQNYESNKQNIVQNTLNISNGMTNTTYNNANSNSSAQQANPLVFNMFNFDSQMERALTKQIGLKQASELGKLDIWQLSLEESELKSNQPDFKEIFGKKQQPKSKQQIESNSFQTNNYLLSSMTSNQNNGQFNLFQQYNKPNASQFQSYQPQANTNTYSFTQTQSYSSDNTNYFDTQSMHANHQQQPQFSMLDTPQQYLNFNSQHISYEPQYFTHSNKIIQPLKQPSSLNHDNLFYGSNLYPQNDQIVKQSFTLKQTQVEQSNRQAHINIKSNNNNSNEQNDNDDDNEWQQAQNVNQQTYQPTSQNSYNYQTAHIIQNNSQYYQKQFVYQPQLNIENNNKKDDESQGYRQVQSKGTFNGDLFDFGLVQPSGHVHQTQGAVSSGNIETNYQNLQFLMAVQDNNQYLMSQTTQIKHMQIPIPQTSLNQIDNSFNFNYPSSLPNQIPISLSLSQPHTQTYQYGNSHQQTSSYYNDEPQKQYNNQALDPLFSNHSHDESKYNILNKLKVYLSQKNMTYLEKSLNNKYYQCDTQCYEIALNYLREVEQQNTPEFSHFRDQLKIVQQIHELTNQNTAAVEEDEEQKVEMALKQTKRLYSEVYKQSAMTQKYLLRLMDQRSKEKGILYKFGRILIDSSISMQIIQKCCNQENKTSIFNSFCVNYTLEKLNLYFKVRSNTQKMVQYLNQEHNKYKELCNSSLFSQVQESPTQYPQYVTYIKGLLKLASLCQKMLQLCKVSCIKTNCNVVKTMKICKDLKLRYDKLLDNQQSRFILFYLKDFFRKVVSRNSSLYEIYTKFIQRLQQFQFCHICLEQIDRNGDKHNQISYHYSCLNILHKLQS